MRNSIIQAIEQKYLKTENIPQFEVGDTVDVATRIIEGEKERIQVFSGTVIMIKNSGINQLFTVRRIVNNEGVERIFPTHSPFISKVTVRRSGENRRAKLFYLRDRVGKAVRLADKRKVAKKDEPAAAEKAEPAVAAAT
jgi:large subunit ribosomal protein L19